MHRNHGYFVVTLCGHVYMHVVAMGNQEAYCTLQYISNSAVYYYNVASHIISHEILPDLQ